MKTNCYLKKAALLLCLVGFSGPLKASTFVIDKANSKVSIDVKATMDSFVGKLSNYDAVIKGNKATKKPSQVSFNWKFSDLKTGKDKRDSKMISWLDNKTKGSFVLTSFDKRSDGRTWAKGKMTIHGVTQAVEFPVKVIAKGNKMSIRGTASVDTRKFDLPIIKMMGMLKVDPIVKVSFSLRGKLQ